MENFILKKLFAIGLIAAAGLVSGEVKDHWFFGEDYGELLPGSGGGIRGGGKVFLGFTPQDPEYEILMGKYLAGVEKHFREKGWLDKAYVLCDDEPQPREIERLEKLKK